MTGFGAALTGSSAWLIFNHKKRDEIMNILFGKIENGGAGISFLRVPVSLLSDFMAEAPYSYINDNDSQLRSFSIDKGWMIAKLLKFF